MSLTQINKAGLDEIALDHVFTIGANGTAHYTFQGEGLNGTVNDPTLYLTRGKTYRFENGSGGHPIRIQSTSGASGTAYNTGVTNNAGGGTVIVEVQHDAPDVLYYQCTSHANMGGTLYITGALPDGGVTRAKLANSAVDTLQLETASVNADKIATGAVTTVKIAGDAVDGTKIADDSINSEHYVDGSIDTAHIADQAVDLTKLPHGTSSNDGKFLRANNGADPTFETVSGTTINNNADNRVITGSGSANTLNGEAKLTFDGDIFSAKNSSNTSGIDFNVSGSNPRIDFNAGSVASSGIIKSEESGSGAIMEFHNKNSSGSEQQVIALTVDRNLQINDGNVIFASGHGIDFSATANAALFAPASPTQSGQGYDPSTDSEILTHYEHGTWTPRLRAYDHTGNAGWGHMVYSDGTVVEGTGRYIRIGRLVWAGYQISTGSKVFDSNWTYWSIDTIPFGANHYDGRSGGNYVFQTNAFTDTTNHIGGNVNGADAYLVGNRPSGEYNATINTSNNSRIIRGYALFYTSTG